MINIGTKGTLNTKMPEVAMDLFEEMAMNNYQWHDSRARSNKPGHVYDVDVVTTLVVQAETLSKKIDGLTITKQQAPIMHCDLYRRGYGSQEC